jgi:O-antigen/teichoic acid export membrane protein
VGINHSTAKSSVSVFESTSGGQHENSSVANPESALGSPCAGIGTRVFQNTIVQLGGRAISLLFSFATSILLARYLGRERMGEYGAIYAYLSLYAFLATFGLDQILAREVSLRRTEAAQIFHTGSLVALGFAVAGALFASLFAPLFGYTGAVRWLIAVAAIDLLILPPIRFPGIVFQVDMRQWYMVATGLLRQVLWLVALILLAMGKAAFYQVIVARTLCGVAEAGMVIAFSRRGQLLEGPRRFIREDARHMLRDALPMVMTSIAVGIYHRIDQVMLHNMAGDHALGPYVIAVQLIEQFSALPVALISSLFPILARTASDETRFTHYLSTSYRLLLLVVFGACAVMTPIAAPLIQLLYGTAYLPTAALLIVLIWSEVPVFFGVAISNAIVARGLQRYLPLSTAVGAVTNILLNLALIPRYGALGASWATVVSYWLASVLMFLCFPATRRLCWTGFRFVLPLFVCALIISAVTNALPWAFWWKLAVAGTAFPISAWMAGTLRQEEIQWTLSLLRGRLYNV